MFAIPLVSVILPLFALFENDGGEFKHSTKLLTSRTGGLVRFDGGFGRAGLYAWITCCASNQSKDNITFTLKTTAVYIASLANGTWFHLCPTSATPLTTLRTTATFFRRVVLIEVKGDGFA